MHPDRVDFRPLYAQVKALLVERISSGAWKPGEMIPNEFDLASIYNVSQGTVRKALMALEADCVIERRQGLGTFVARHTRERALFHFFRMAGPDGRRLTPASRVLSQRILAATPDQAASLSVEPGAKLHAVVRIRQFGERPAIFERVFVPVTLMPGLRIEIGSVLEEEMYVIYEGKFGISVARASEQITAVSATAKEAGHLKIAEGSPLLQIRRVARDIGGSCVELRISRCTTEHTHYAAEVY